MVTLQRKLEIKKRGIKLLGNLTKKKVSYIRYAYQGLRVWKEEVEVGLRLGVEGYKRMSARGRMDKVLLESLSSEPLTWEFVGKGMVVFGMQRQWQSAEVALNFPVLVLEELIERGFFKKLRDREVEGLVPADAGAMADQKPPVSLGQPERAGYKYADLKCASLDTLVDQEIDVTSCYETCRENNS